MNFKKFISGVSALTIAASAFAGMAVTASAEAATSITVNYKLSGGATVKTVSLPTADTTVGAEYSYTSPNYIVGEGTYNGIYYYVAADYESTIGQIGSSNPHGHAVLRQTINSLAATQEIDYTVTPVDTTTVSCEVVGYVEGEDILTPGHPASGRYRMSAGEAGTLTSSYTTVFTASTAGAYKITVTVLGSASNARSELYKGVDNGEGGYTYTLVDNMYPSNTAYGYGYVFSVELAQGDVLAMKNGNKNTYLDYVLVKKMTATPAGAFNIKYQSDDETPKALGSVAADVSGRYVDETYYYGVPKYIINDSDLYEADYNTLPLTDSSRYNASVVLGATNSDITVTYKKTDITNAVYFADFGTFNTVTGASSNAWTRKYLSGGAVARQGELVPANILSGGYYKLDINAYTARSSYIKIGDTITTNSITTGQGENSFTVKINANEAVSQVTGEGSSAVSDVDYILVRRLGDYSFTFTDTNTVEYGNSGGQQYLPVPAKGPNGETYAGWLIDGVYYAGGTYYTFTDHDVSADVANPPTATAAQYGDDISADEGYEGTDTVASVFRAEVNAGTYDITSVQFTLNNGEKTTDTWSGNIASGSPVVFGLIVPMAGADVNNIKAVLNGASYDAYTKAAE